MKVTRARNSGTEARRAGALTATRAGSSSSVTTRPASASTGCRSRFVQDNHSRSAARRSARAAFPDGPPGQARGLRARADLGRRGRRSAGIADLRPAFRRRAHGPERAAALDSRGLRARVLRARRASQRTFFIRSTLFTPEHRERDPLVGSRAGDPLAARSQPAISARDQKLPTFPIPP